MKNKKIIIEREMYERALKYKIKNYDVIKILFENESSKEYEILLRILNFNIFDIITISDCYISSYQSSLYKEKNYNFIKKIGINLKKK